MNALSGKHALVTGASRGIGAAIAATLHAQGARVTLVARNREALQRHTLTLSGSGEAHAIAADVTAEHEVDAAFAQAKWRFGAVDILVNNAGMAASGPFGRLDSGTWNAVLALNLGAAFVCTRAAISDMLAEGWGRIVNVASTAGLAGSKYIAAYCAAKHGVVGLTRALAAEYAESGITVNAVCPGFVETDLFERAVANVARASGRDEAGTRAAMLAQNGQFRAIAPEEVARTVAWLCEPASAGITGQAIVIDASGAGG
jgi:NAD(P)-dependent dehydrogenase (short-subunit alcohol dehydrogenase family)